MTFATPAVSNAELVRHSKRRAMAKKRSQLIKARTRCEDFLEYAIRDEETGGILRNAPFHKEWQQFLRANKRATLVAPVEHGKTQQFVGLIIHMLGNNPNARIAVISNTADQAEKMLRQVRTHIESNPRVHEVFPNLRPSPKTVDPWHSTMITVERSTIAKDPSVQSHGVFGPINGSRLDCIILDDVLSFDNTRTEEQRKKLLDWFDTTVFTRSTKNSRIYAIGTPWHPEDFLHDLEQRPGFASKRYCAVENPLASRKDWVPIWPAQWSTARLIDRQDNMLDTHFSRKYLTQARMDETSRFKEEWMRWMAALGKGRTFEAQQPMAQGNVRPLRCYTGVDLGVGTKEENALTVLFTLAQMDNGRRLIVNIESGHWKAPEIIDRLESHYRRFDSTIMVESNGAQKFIVDMALDKSIPVEAFHTGNDKWDPEWGVESLAVEMRNRLWVMPSGTAGDRVPDEGKQFFRNCLNFNPTEHTGDHLMAAWLARECMRAHGLPMTHRIDTLSR